MTETAAEERDHSCMAVSLSLYEEANCACVCGWAALGWMAGMDRPECIGGKKAFQYADRVLCL